MSETQLTSFRVQAGQRCVVPCRIQEVAEKDTFHKSLEQLAALLKDHGDDRKLRDADLTSPRISVSPNGSNSSAESEVPASIQVWKCLEFGKYATFCCCDKLRQEAAAKQFIYPCSP
eukprot:scpid84931/ scgid7561/ 